jgi:hypothetical protein
MKTGFKPMKILPTPAATSKVFFTGSSIGTVIDSLHNQCLLRYNVAPITVEWPTFLNDVVASASSNRFLFNEYLFTSSWTVPFLLGVAYIVLGSILPAIIQNFIGIILNLAGIRETSNLNNIGDQFLNGERLAEISSRQSLQIKAVLAVSTTAGIVKLSEFLVLNPSFGNDYLSIFSNSPEQQHSILLFCCVVIQWIALDRSLSSLITAWITSIGGPLSELPFVAAGVWEYLPAVSDKLPLEGLAHLLESDSMLRLSISSILGANFDKLAISSVSEPCYFAVCLDAIALRRFFQKYDKLQ